MPPAPLEESTTSMFEIFPWNPHLETGIALIDEQHRVLVKLLNRLAQQHVQGATEAEIHGILGELADYAVYHFSTEEGIWHTAMEGDSWLAQHIQSHQKFFSHIEELRSGSRPFQTVLDDLFSYLTQWLAYHILDNDKRMAMVVKGVNQGQSIQAAQHAADIEMRGATAVLIQTVLSMYQTVSAQALELMHEKLARQRAEEALRSTEDRWHFLQDGANQSHAASSPLEKHLRTLLDHVPTGLVVADAKTGLFVFANPWFCRMLGYSQDELLTMTPLDIHPPEDLATVQSDFQSMKAGQTQDSLAIAVRRKDGSIFAANIERVPLDLNGQTSVLAIVSDVTERHRAEQALQASESHLRTLVNTIPDLIWLKNVQGVYLACNPAFERFFGAAESAIVGKTDHNFVTQELADFFQEHDRAAMAAQHPVVNEEWVTFASDGQRRLLETTKVAMHHSSGELIGVLGISHDITEQRAHREQIEYITHHDAQTGLPNRKLFVDTLAIDMAKTTEQQHLAVAYIDLDDFAAFNHTHGLLVGNQLIVEVSQRLTQAMQEHQLLAHIGGDEFAVIFSHLDHPDAYIDPVQNLLRLLSQPLMLNGLKLTVTASIGVTLFQPKDKFDAEQLLRQADQAMYLAKQAGKNRHHLFDPINDEVTRDRLMRIDEIRLALEQNQFVLYYQPKVQLITGEVIGFEALIRWQHPTRGTLPPAVFIPLLDKHPLAITLGDWVIETALAQLAQWTAQGLQTTVSVNIDALQLHDPDFTDRLKQQLHQEPSVLPNQLELEILETGALENMAHVSALIAQLQNLGFECALDDFGTGYSSLTFLKQLAAHTLKIDQSFVRGMLDDAEHATIVNSVLGLARNFERRALAEGVETEALGRTLIEFGCAFGQGYAIARPMPAGEVPDWLLKWRPPTSWAHSEAAPPRDMAMLLAEIEHRAWLKQVHDYLAQPTQLVPANDRQLCRFGQWLSKPATQRRFAHHLGFSDLQASHQALHQAAAPLLSRLPAQGLGDDATELATLQALSQIMLEQLRDMRQSEPHVEWSNSSYSDL